VVKILIRLKEEATEHTENEEGLEQQFMKRGFGLDHPVDAVADTGSFQQANRKML
jgi:hypothetical protein